MLDNKVFARLAYLVPVIIIYYSATLFPGVQKIMEKATVIAIYLVLMLVADAVLKALNEIYKEYVSSHNKPIKGYIQVIRIAIFIIGGIAVISAIIGQNPIVVLSALGALSAVLLVIFKDSLLGLVAGILISTNDLVRLGDWIEVPKFNTTGTVTDITLHTVKIENFDKTFTTLPSYALISDSFKNYRGMLNTGGRRIIRAVNIDMTSIDFCTPEMIEDFKKISYLKEYLESKEKEIAEYNKTHDFDTGHVVNGRRLTNIGTFRAYLLEYLKHHPGIRNDLTMMVRQLSPCEHGVPLEIYAFTNNTEWVTYETIQADIFDHVMAVVPHFGLKLYQNPSGADLHYLAEKSNR
jgi:miniconductance mechanosensitive channel